MIEILTAAAVFGFSLGFSQEMAKDLRRMLRRHRSRGPVICRASGGLRSDPSKWQRLIFDEPSGFEPDPPIRLDEGPVQRGNGSGGPTTQKPPIKPTPQGGRLIRIDQEPPPPSDP